jgi:hypothetical protein
MKKTKAVQGGVAGIRAHFQDAMAILNDAKAIEDPDPNKPRNGIKPGQWDGAPHDRMPPDCPVTVLGKKGDAVYVISAIGEMHEVTRWDLPTLTSLFAPYVNYLFWAWPAFGKAEQDPETGEALPPKVKRVERDKAAMALIAEAGRKGIFDPQSNVRGRGGWKAQDKFIWHNGKMLFSVDVKTEAKSGRAQAWNLQATRPGEFDGYFYAQDSEILSPWREPVGYLDSPAHQILQDLKSWKWERPTLDPVLFLGWLMSAYLSGALEVRPILFTTGGAGTGKSTLHGIVRALLGSALYSTANTTAAGIYQNIRQDSRPVAVDEFERKAGGTKEQAIVELARQAYSGAKGYRGGANGDGTEFELRSSFMFSAILHPHLGVQDRTRMVILNLNPLDKNGASEQPIIKEEWGRMLLRQVMDGWHDLNTFVLPKWRRILSSSRLAFDARAIDTYGTVLACAELAVGELGLVQAGFPSLAPGSAELDADCLVDLIAFATAEERAAQMPKWQEVIEKVMSATLEMYVAGRKPSVGETVGHLEQGTDLLDLREARARLAMMGLGLRDKGKPGQGYCLAIPKNDDKLNRLFYDGEFNHGGWTMALKQAPDSIVLRGLERKFTNVDINRLTKDCLLVDLAGYDAWTGRGDVEA